MKARRFFYYGKFVVLGILGLILFTFVVMWLWNWLVPALFNGPVLTYWQTLGILVLSKILFSGIGKGHHSHDHDCRHDYRDKFKEKWKNKFEEKWKEKFEEKMNGMTDEKRNEGDPVVT